MTIINIYDKLLTQVACQYFSGMNT